MAKKPVVNELDDIQQTHYWQRHFDEAAEFFFPTIKFTGQQKEGFTELSKLIRAKLNLYDRKPLSEEEAEYSKKIGLSIQSGFGTGKDAFASVCILLFTMLFPDPKNMVTANTAKQLKNVLWSEISTWMRRYCRKATPESKYTLMEERLELQSEKLFLKELKGEGWFTEAVTINTSKSSEEQASAIAGRHADYQLIVLDEACGIADAVPLKLEKTLTRKLNLMLLIFNPETTKGYAIDSQHDQRFVSLRWSSEDSELVTREQIEAIETKYGRDSNPFRISVLGLPPLTESDAFFPLEWIERATDMIKEPCKDDPLIKAMDCGAGGDKSVIAARRGNYIYPLKRKNTPDSNQLEGWAANEMEDATVFIIDKKGIGWAVHGHLALVKGSKVKAYDGSWASINPDRWDNKRVQCYSIVRDKFEQGVISIPADKEFKFQLMCIKGVFDKKGHMNVSTKKDVKKAIGHSSDEVDSVVMLYSVDDVVYREEPEEKEDRRSRHNRLYHTHPDAWMLG